MVIYTTSFNPSIKHSKKNQIRGAERKKIENMLKTDKAKVVVADLANEYLRIGDVEPPFLPNVSTLRQMKSGSYDHLIFHDDQVISLHEMKYVEPYQNSIGNIGLDPFDCSFCTPYQQELLRI